MTEEQTEIIVNAYAAFLSGEIDRDQYQDVRRMIADELLNQTLVTTID